MTDDLETILGEIPVVARLALGSQRLTLFPTNTRIIVASVGKRGAGALATVSFFGRLSGAVEDLLKGGKEFRSKQKLRTMSPGEILSHDKANFSIAFDDVVRVELEEMPYSVGITVLTRDEKFEFFTRLHSDNVAKLLGILGTKLVSIRRSAYQPT